MEADAFKEENNTSQQTASDLASTVPCSKIIIDKIMLSLSPGWVSNMNEFPGKQCPLLYSSEASGRMVNSNDSTEDLKHDQAFQYARQLGNLSSSAFLPQKFTSSVTQAGIHDASDTLEMFTPPLLPASELGMNHYVPTYKNMEQVSLLQIITEFITAHYIFLVVAQPLQEERISNFCVCLLVGSFTGNHSKCIIILCLILLV